MNDTPYYKARLRAAERDSAFESRQSAGAVEKGLTNQDKT